MATLPPCGLPPNKMRRLLTLLCVLICSGWALPAGADGLPAPARRIVTLDWGVAETLVALGAPPAGVPDIRGYADWVADPPLPAGTVNLGSRFEPNLELIRSLKPDLIILIPFQSGLEPLLRRIAPTLTLSVHQGVGQPYAAAQEATRTLGRLTGREAEAEALITRTETILSDSRARFAVAPPPPVLVSAVADAHHLWVFGQGSLYGDLLGRLGLRNGWTEPVSDWGFSAVGADRLAEAGDSTFVTLRPLPPDYETGLTQSPLWQALPFVQAGRVTVLPPVLMFGMLPSSARFATLLADALVPR